MFSIVPIYNSAFENNLLSPWCYKVADSAGIDRRLVIFRAMIRTAGSWMGLICSTLLDAQPSTHQQWPELHVCTVLGRDVHRC